MISLDQIAKDLFNKIRGRFPSVTIGDEDGNITNEPEKGRFFDFDYTVGKKSLGKVSITILEDEGLAVIFSKDFIRDQNKMTQEQWYDFLRDLRSFSKKRMLGFSVRDIKKSNLTKRDYKFLAANRTGDNTMTESKLYGTGRISYQNFDNARLVIKHNESVNPEIPSSRTRNIDSIYIESEEGERFKYPYKHLSGARAMARHVAEGGVPYDDFGSHITGLSEEMSKLRKFKNYVGRSSVMAESLEGYMDIVKERISTVKKTIENLQKPTHYREAIDGFETPVFEEVPDDVKENWIDELTIKQFNEELQDIFPYIYNLVKEGTKAKELGPDDLLGEAASDCDETCPKSCPDCGGTGDPEKYEKMKEQQVSEKWKKSPGDPADPDELASAGEPRADADTKVDKKAYALDKASNSKKKVSLKKVPWEESIEEHFESLMGQFGDVCEECGNPSWRTLGLTEEEIEEGERHGNSKIYDKCWKGYRKVPGKTRGEKGSCKKVGENNLDEAAVPPGYTMARIIERPVTTGTKRIGSRKGVDVGDEKKQTIIKKAIFGNFQNPLELTMKTAEYTTSVKDAEHFIKIAERLLSDRLHKINGIVLFFTDSEKDSKKWRPYVDAIEELNNPKIQVSTRESRETGGGAGAVKVKRKDDDDSTSWADPTVKKTAPEKRKTIVFKAENKKLIDFMKRKQPEYMARYYKPADKEFVMGEKAFESFKQIINSPKWKRKFGETLIMINNEKSFSEEKDVPYSDSQKQKTPLGEFILSYFDRHSGQFPKGETAVLTMVEKDYGEEFIEPAKAFIEEVNNLVSEYHRPQESEINEFDRIKQLAGI